MTPDQITTTRASLREQEPALGAMAATGMNARPTGPLLTHDALMETIRSFAPVEGWVTQQSKNLDIRDRVFDPDLQNNGLILSGELIDGQSRSLHVRYQSGSSGWKATVYELIAGDQYCADELRYLSSTNERECLAYKRVWYKEASGLYRIEAIFFTGFQPV